MIRRLFVFLINLYQKYISLDTGIPKKIGISRGFICMHYPTCSEYTKQAIEKYGVRHGIGLGLRRISRCRPGTDPTVDPLR